MNYKKLYEIEVKKNNDLLKQIGSLMQFAYTDELTGTYNRYGMKKRLNETKKPYCLLFIDLDNFKLINDTYGHICGDKILITITKLISENISDNDFIARVGGDEFVIFFEDTNVDNIYNLGMSIKDQIKQIKNPLESTLSFSGGLALYRQTEDILEAIKKIDSALYQSKKDGKDKITIIK